ncbi:MAG: PAS domain-containing protein [Verrucomicrobiales bacterium]|nr:PAS domain-containing protein [Verrucomicrobiales bacterium]
MDIALIIALATATGILAWRHWALLRGIRQISHLIRSDAPAAAYTEDLPDTPSLAFQTLAKDARDLIAEATLGRALESSHRTLLESLLDQIDDALLIVDENAEVRFSNRAARRLFPSDQPHTGRTLIEVCIDHHIAETLDLAWRIGAKTQERLHRRVSAAPDGRLERDYLVEAEPLTGYSIGRGAWVLVRDITLQVETDRVRQDFVANASHELRTPLSILIGYLEMLDESSKPTPATLRRCIPTMRRHAERLALLVEDMLTISKLESPESLLNRDTFDLGDSIRDSIDQLTPIIDRQHARLHLELPASAPFLGDRLYWDQVFFNLIENALKQNPEPGLNVTVRLTPADGRYQIEVIDDGMGIPSADLPHIFKRFYRVQKDHAQTIKGTGLGLSIVRRAVEAHHGTIRARSHPGRETAFIIDVPQPLLTALPGSDHTEKAAPDDRAQPVSLATGEDSPAATSHQPAA